MEGEGGELPGIFLEDFYSLMLKLSVAVHLSLTDKTFDVAMATA